MKNKHAINYKWIPKHLQYQLTTNMVLKCFLLCLSRVRRTEQLALLTCSRKMPKKSPPAASSCCPHFAHTWRTATITFRCTCVSFYSLINMFITCALVLAGTFGFIALFERLSSHRLCSLSIRVLLMLLVWMWRNSSSCVQPISSCCKCYILHSAGKHGLVSR